MIGIVFDIKNVPMCDVAHFIHNSVPPEGLHTYGSDVYEALILYSDQHDWHKNENKEDKNELDKLQHRIFCHLVKKQSERDNPNPMV